VSPGDTPKPASPGDTPKPVLPDDDAPRRGSSPACFLDEVDPAYAGYLTTDEVAATLAELVAAERALAALASALAAGDPALRPPAEALAAAAQTTARELVAAGAPPLRESRFVTPADSMPTPEALAEAHRALCTRLRATRPRIASDALHAAINRMLARQEACAGTLAAG
jgi:hypothetical protein